MKKQVSLLKRKIKVYKWRSIKPKVEVSTVTTQTGPIEELFEGQEFILATEIQNWQSAVIDHKKEKVSV